MSGYFTDIYTGMKSLAIGMGITFKNFKDNFSETKTLQYPHEYLEMTPRYRGHIELVADAETGEALCVACGMCEKGCPSGCISVKSEKLEGSKKKVVTVYDLDFTKCSLCGQCVESCKFGAITFSKEYNLASTRKEDFYFDLIKRLKGTK